MEERKGGCKWTARHPSLNKPTLNTKTHRLAGPVRILDQGIGSDGVPLETWHRSSPPLVYSWNEVWQGRVLA
ncbi:hypothetical protein BDM02DRAFT_3114291 [Thelephora ganbajun]|uniref:Uncharacterized protein n=1 Tax=Thelephora ganbajun TaxID=370292 RepID=A0ACB6ZJ30_THEGA|nr:hypothetical protein BDM02DRAFT_3114291 [Thelephora ganbajun]